MISVTSTAIVAAPRFAASSPAGYIQGNPDRHGPAVPSRNGEFDVACSWIGYDDATG
jgi:hypothetical protein